MEWSRMASKDSQAAGAAPENNKPIEVTKEKSAPVPKSGKNGSGHANGEYTADSIKVLGGMEAVRKRPAMYIGSTGEMGLHHLVYEVVDNSVDEALAGFADRVDVTIHIDNSITVVDNGRGIPVDDMDIDGERVPAAQVVMTTLHAGGKFDSSTYKVSGGLHGVGVSCVNALSHLLELEIWRDGSVWEQSYSKGEATTKLKKTGTTKKRGTQVTFLPDREIFTVTEYNFDTLAQRLREMAFLNKGLLITLTDERATDAKTGEAKKAEFKYNGGIAEFIKHLNRGKSCTTSPSTWKSSATAWRWKLRSSTTTATPRLCSASPTTSIRLTAARTCRDSAPHSPAPLITPDSSSACSRT
jgi:DNA gyrase subunit B